MKFLLGSLSIALATSTLASASLAADQPAEPAPAIAQMANDAERLDLARQFVAFIRPADELLNMMREAALSSAQAQLDPEAGEAETAALEKRIHQLFAKLEPKFKAQQPAIVDAYARAYAQHFTIEELRAMVAFGYSPAGRHYLSSTVDIEKDPGVLQANQLLADVMLSATDDFRKESCAQRAAERLAAGDTKAKCPLSEESEAHSG